jgi:two-component system KDP operon response regulator KdpE
MSYVRIHIEQGRTVMSERELVQPSHRERILVVEDDEAVGEMLTMLLEMEGYHVQLVQTAVAALQVLLPSDEVSEACGMNAPHMLHSAAPRPAVVLLDLQLPGMSGEDMIQQLRTVPVATPPIIVLSARRQAALEEVAALDGVVAVVPKPFPVEELLESISMVLEQ